MISFLHKCGAETGGSWLWKGPHSERTAFTSKEPLLLWNYCFSFDRPALVLFPELFCSSRLAVASDSGQSQGSVSRLLIGGEWSGGGACFLRVFAKLSFGPHRPCSASLPHLYLMLTMFRTSSVSTRRDRTRIKTRTWTLFFKQTKPFIGRYQCLHL